MQDPDPSTSDPCASTDITLPLSSLSCTVGNTAFRNSLTKLSVNLRRVAFVNDVIGYLPCSSAPNSGMNAMPACKLALVSTDTTPWIDLIKKKPISAYSWPE